MEDLLPERFSSLIVCAGAGGLALGLEQAGFDPVLLLDNRSVACETLRLNRPGWNVLEADLLDFDPVDHHEAYDVDLLAAGLPRVKATATVTRKDSDEEIRLLQATIMLMHAVQPRALLVENVPDLVSKPAYEPIRTYIARELEHLGYRHRWLVLNAMDFDVPQDRKQGILVAFKGDHLDGFAAPAPNAVQPVTVGAALGASMAARGWPQAAAWTAQADRVAPTLVGGSWNRGGADLGPTGSKRTWARMGVNGGTVADLVPGPDFRLDPTLGAKGLVPLTVGQAARLQGFPIDWEFAGRKTARYRQVGHASPPPVGHALGLAIRTALNLDE
ncbi:DNA cytosine methyltransferase [Streptomyces iconiensis]|uniref:DNA (cytosine-5-)-methyltransferase n=1 Tax=Streptomyces iconiensis TaxID=1384038 RepID=A0ABT7A0Y4_9ACTN|nr:DNA cytosine methyltransferase [Streptomyces iconiensis]MDJ1134501.1 DNA cytosine methyltransferase [Streptomyces iconiensis]